MQIQKLLLVALLNIYATQVKAADLVVVVSAKSPVTSLSVAQVSDIFLGQMTSFPEGREAIAIDQKPGSSIRDEFYLKTSSKSPSLMKAYWSKMLFTGRGQPPKYLADSSAVRKLVAGNTSLIGYVDKTEIDASIKVVLIVP